MLHFKRESYFDTKFVDCEVLKGGVTYWRSHTSRPGSKHLAALGKATFWRPAVAADPNYYATNTSN